MRVITTAAHPEHYAYRLSGRRRTLRCRVYLRVYLFAFLMPGLHRPTGCGHWHRRRHAHPGGWAGERP